MVAAWIVNCYLCHKVSWVNDMKVRYTENRVNKNLSMQNGEKCGTDTYLQYGVFLFSLKGLIKNLFQQILLYFYDKKEHAEALLSSPSLAPQLQSGFAMY